MTTGEHDSQNTLDIQEASRSTLTADDDPKKFAVDPLVSSEHSPFGLEAPLSNIIAHSSAEMSPDEMSSGQKRQCEEHGEEDEMKRVRQDGEEDEGKIEDGEDDVVVDEGEEEVEEVVPEVEERASDSEAGAEDIDDNPVEDEARSEGDDWNESDDWDDSDDWDEGDEEEGEREGGPGEGDEGEGGGEEEKDGPNWEDRHRGDHSQAKDDDTLEITAEQLEEEIEKIRKLMERANPILTEQLEQMQNFQSVPTQTLLRLEEVLDDIKEEDQMNPMFNQLCVRWEWLYRHSWQKKAQERYGDEIRDLLNQFKVLLGSFSVGIEDYDAELSLFKEEISRHECQQRGKGRRVNRIK